jgi:micrococcal nuclease
MGKRLIPLVFAFLVIAPAAFGGGTMVKVLSIVNGNTIKADVRGKEMEIRLLGIATPNPEDTHEQLRQLGAEAKSFLAEFLKSHSVYAEFPTGDPAPDKNGVINALLWGGANAEFINEKIVSDGFGVVDRRQAQLTQALRDQLIQAEDAARNSGHGLWGSFSSGSGHDVAAGKTHQGTYLGTINPSREGSAVTDVYVWVIFFR